MAKRSFCGNKHHHPSKSEARYCEWLQARVDSGDLISFKLSASVPIKVLGKRKRWKIDFLAIAKDGSEEFHECHEMWDKGFILKRDGFRICFPVLKLFVNKKLFIGKPDIKRIQDERKRHDAAKERARRYRKNFYEAGKKIKASLKKAA